MAHSASAVLSAYPNPTWWLLLLDASNFQVNPALKKTQRCRSFFKERKWHRPLQTLKTLHTSNNQAWIGQLSTKNRKKHTQKLATKISRNLLKQIEKRGAIKGEKKGLPGFSALQTLTSSCTAENNERQQGGQYNTRAQWETEAKPVFLQTAEKHPLHSVYSWSLCKALPERNLYTRTKSG